MVATIHTCGANVFQEQFGSVTNSDLELASDVAHQDVVAQLVDNIVLQPTIFSRSVKAHPLEIFTVSMITATLAGPLSMIFAIPLYTFLRIVAKEFLAGYKVVQGLTKNL